MQKQGQLPTTSDEEIQLGLEDTDLVLLASVVDPIIIET